MRSVKNLQTRFINGNPKVKKWLKGRPKGTVTVYSLHLRRFCNFANIEPEKFQLLDKKTARDLVWDYLCEFKDEKPSVALLAIAALKSFYRNHDGEKLEFDTGRGGKHCFIYKRVRAATEHVPSNEEIYDIAEHCIRLRDKTIVLVLFQSGIRVNALCRLTYKMVRRQLEKGQVPLRLRITDTIDTKLARTRVTFYDTFLNVEAIELLRKYCESTHQKSDDDTPLFLSKTGKQLLPSNVWANTKKAIRRAGLDESNITIHSLRKAFKRQVRNSRINHDHGEMLMGHVLNGAQENYAVRNEMIEELRNAYIEIDLSKEGKRSFEFADLNEKINKLKSERDTLNNVVASQSIEIQKLKETVDETQDVGKFIDHLYKQMEDMQQQINKLTGKKRELKVPDFVQPEQE